MATEEKDRLDRSECAASARMSADRDIEKVIDEEKAGDNESNLNDSNSSAFQGDSVGSTSNRPVSDVEKAAADGVNVTDSKADDEYPHGIKLAMLLLSIYLSVFLVALDRTIIATALPQITNHFKSFADIGWVSPSPIGHPSYPDYDLTLTSKVQCRVLAPNDCIPALLREDVHLLLSKMDFHEPCHDLRGRFCRLRRRT